MRIASCWKLADSCTCAYGRRVRTMIAVDEHGHDKGAAHERGTRTGRHPKGRIHPDIERKTGRVACHWSPLRGLGDVSPQGVAGRSEPALSITMQRLVRADDAAFRRRRQVVGTSGQ